MNLPNRVGSFNGPVGFVPEHRHQVIELPKLDVMTLHQLLGTVLRGRIVRAQKLDSPADVPIVANDVRSILRHVGIPRKEWPINRRGVCSVPGAECKARRVLQNSYAIF
jgi:hypothetical protein